MNTEYSKTELKITIDGIKVTFINKVTGIQETREFKTVTAAIVAEGNFHAAMIDRYYKG